MVSQPWEATSGEQTLADPRAQNTSNQTKPRWHTKCGKHNNVYGYILSILFSIIRSRQSSLQVDRPSLQDQDYDTGDLRENVFNSENIDKWEETKIICAVMVVVLFFWDRAPCRLGWPQTQYVVDNGLEFLILLSPCLAQEMRLNNTEWF